MVKSIGYIIFAIILFFILSTTIPASASGFGARLQYAFLNTKGFIGEMLESIKILFTRKVTVDEFVGPVGISGIVAQTSGIKEYVYIISVVSMSLGITNLLPFPPLDGGKILLLIIEAIRKKPLKQETELKIQMMGFTVLILLSVFVTFNDITKIVGGIYYGGTWKA